MIAIYTTGGTIDNLEYKREDRVPVEQSSIIPELMSYCLVNTQYFIEEVSFKDGRFITVQDRMKIAKKCKETNAQKIIITHGTTTMVETAKFLENMELSSKTIVITGSMVLGTSRSSDALFNLGYAFAQVSTLPNGIYLAMNGQVFLPNNVKKDLINKRFTTIK